MNKLLFLGHPQLIVGGQNITGNVPIKGVALLGYLLVVGEVQRREALAMLLWGETTDAKARGSLRTLLYDLQKKLPDLLAVSRTTVGLVAGHDYWCDVVALGAALESPHPNPLPQRVRAQTLTAPRGEGLEMRALSSTLDLYRGQLLATVYLDDAPSFQDWLRGEQESWRLRVLAALDGLVGKFEEMGDWESAIRSLRQLLTIEPWREESHRQLMRLLLRTEQLEAGLRQFQECRHLLSTELGVDPAPETTTLANQIKSVRNGQISLNLPHLTSPLVGRRREIAQILGHLDDTHCRLLTLRGIGGIGKTTLALHVGGLLGREFRDGATFVPLAPVTDGGLLPSVVAGVLGWKMPASARTPTQQIQFLSQRLKQKEMLLIFDNYEHLVEETSLITTLLDRAPALKILVTSRELLRLRGEWVVEVAGMSVPDTSTAETFTYDAPQLFLKSITRILPSFQLAATDHPAVHRICQLVDGMPLALEMAAAWAQTESLSAIVAEIETDLDFLVSDKRDSPDRHHSVRAIFDHSWQLLSPAEQTVLGAFSVFRGDFSVKAARQITGCTQVVLKQLGQKSLLMSVDSGRLALHPLVTQFAGEKLGEKAREYGGKHAAFYLEGVGGQLVGIRQGNAGIFAALRQDLNEIRQAWRWAFTHEAIHLLQTSVVGLAHLYHNETLNSELLNQLQTAFEYFNNPIPTDLAQRKLCAYLLAEIVNALNNQGDYQQAIALCTQYLPSLQELAKQYGIVHPLAVVYQQQGSSLYRLGQFDEAAKNLQLAIQYATEHDLPYTLALSYSNMGSIAFLRSDAQVGHEYGKLNYDIVQAHKFRGLEGLWLNNRGTLAITAGDYVTAVAYFEKALAVFQEIGNQQGIVRCEHNLGSVLLEQGYLHECIAYIERVVATREKIGYQQGKARAMRSIGRAYMELGELERAKACFQEIIPIFEEAGVHQQLLWIEAHCMEIAIREGAFAEAKRIYETVLPKLEKLNDLRGMCELAQKMGVVCRHLNDYPASEKQLQKAEQLWQEIGNASGMCRLHIDRGMLELAQGNLYLAKERAEQALEIAEQGDICISKARALTLLGQVAQAQGAKKEGIQYFEEALNLRKVMKQADEVKWLEDLLDS